MLRVLGRGTSGNVQKVVWLLEEMGQSYSREDYGRQFGNTADAAYLALNPSGKVPTLVDGDVVVWESNSILRRSEEHTSELQSLMRISYAVFCLKKKKHKLIQYHQTTIPT